MELKQIVVLASIAERTGGPRSFGAAFDALAAAFALKSSTISFVAAMRSRGSVLGSSSIASIAATPFGSRLAK